MNKYSFDNSEKPNNHLEDDQVRGFIFDLLGDLVWQEDWVVSKQECLDWLINTKPNNHLEVVNNLTSEAPIKAVQLPDGRYVTEELARQMAQEGLDEAADMHIRKVVDEAGHPGWEWETKDIADAFKAGAEWDREQMMKEAVEGEVKHVATVHYVLTNEAQLTARLKQLQDGDKVRIIIVKEDKHFKK